MKPKRQKSTSHLHRPDFFLAATALGLVIFGVVMVYDASVVSAYRDFADKYYYLKNQLVWLVLGLIALVVVSQIDYHLWERLSPLLLFGALVLLLAVLIPGLGVKAYGAQRWLQLGPVRLQPSEMIKLGYILYLSAWLSRKIKLVPFLVVTGFLIGIVLIQKDLGTATIIGSIGFATYFISGASLWQFSLLLPAAAVGGGFFILSSSYRAKRLFTFLDPTKDPLGSSYHINQVLIALGSGGLLGLGLGESRQKYEYLPEVTTDSIFAVIGEELGFIGAIILISIFILLIYRGFKIAQKAPDKFGQLVAGGITSWIAAQAFINLAAMAALIPLTGVPLPFISYGGSALVTTMIGVGILLNISKQVKI
ncbi:MAG: putative lipid II flippase FtsW [Patescibacteria group bacterium]|nr:putative lipid II flippase FtsW [Patescibacteria group bacterium]